MRVLGERLLWREPGLAGAIRGPARLRPDLGHMVTRPCGADGHTSMPRGLMAEPSGSYPGQLLPLPDSVVTVLG